MQNLTHPAEGHLRLFGTAHWSTAAGVRRDVPDNLPGYLLVHLASRADWLPREELAGLFWPDRAEVDAQHNLRANLHRVRSLLAEWGAADALQAERRRVRIDLPTDVGAFRAAVARADWPAAAELHGEPLLSALTFRGFAAVDDWARGQRRALADAWVDATLRAALGFEREEDAAAAARLLLRLAQDEGATEEAMQALLRVAAAACRRDEALAAFERYRVRLRDELELQPVPATLALADALRTAAPGPTSAGPRQATAAVEAEVVPRVRLLGPPLLAGEPPLSFAPERRFQLLALLAVASGEWVARDRLAAMLWPEHALTDARRNLRHVVFKARTLPGAQDLEATDHALRWNVPTDLLALRRAVQAGRPGDALGALPGTPLAGLDDPDNPALAEWLATERARIEALWHQAALDRLRQLDQPAPRRDLALQMLQADPLDEQALAALLQAELALGQRARAEERYRAYATRLMEELGVEPAHALRDLLAPTRPREPIDSSAGAASAPASAFVGRRTELGELGLLLARADCRLVTVLGPGGIGKSSLARRALAAGVAGYPGGTHWIELQDLSDVTNVTARIAQQLGVDLKEGKDPVEQLGARLSGERLLVVLDNAEHLPELPALIGRLLAAGAAMTLLVTSRVRMFVECEWLLPLDGLAVPDAESRDLEASQAFDGVQLFALRATAAQRGFSLARHLNAVIEIVEAVAGMPLAIELAAAWVRLLPPAEIAAELRLSLDMLERDPGSALRPVRPEHASMRNVLERSWQLLAPSEREAMLALSVFRGGFTRAAARAVADVPLPVLSSLVDKSFLKVDEDGRFGMHPLVAADASSRVATREQADDGGRGRHAEYYARTMSELAASHPIRHQPIVAFLSAEVANAQRAWRYAAEAGRRDLLRDMAGCWRRYFVFTGRVEEGTRFFGDVLPLIDEQAATQASAELLAALAWLCFSARDTDRSLALARSGLAQAQTLNDRRLQAECMSTIGACHVGRAEWSDAQGCFAQSLQIAIDLKLRRETASALNNLGVVAVRLGRYDDALDLYARSQAIQSELEDHLAIARLLHNVAAIHMSRGNWSEAKAANEKALRYCEQHGVAALAIPVEFMLGATLIELDDLGAAERALVSARDRARAAQSQSYQLKADYYLARIRVRRGDRAEGARQLFACAHQAKRHGWNYDLLYMAVFIAEALGAEGHGAAAQRLLRSVMQARLVDEAVRTLAVSGLRSVSSVGSVPAAVMGDHGSDEVPSLDAIAERLADVGDLTECAAAVLAATG